MVLAGCEFCSTADGLTLTETGRGISSEDGKRSRLEGAEEKPVANIEKWQRGPSQPQANVSSGHEEVAGL